MARGAGSGLRAGGRRPPPSHSSRSRASTPATARSPCSSTSTCRFRRAASPPSSGANGAGKSTLCKVISGLMTPTQGKIFLEGKDITVLRAHQRASSMLLAPESRGIFPSLSVEENLELRLRTPADRRRAYDRFPVLDERRRIPAGSLSGGEQQMLTMAPLLVRPPQLVIADEPTLGLAPLIVAEIMNIFKDLRDQGVTLLLVEERARAVLDIADDVALLELGRIVWAGPRSQLDDEHLAAIFLGRSQVEEVGAPPAAEYSRAGAGTAGARSDQLFGGQPPPDLVGHLAHDVVDLIGGPDGQRGMRVLHDDELVVGHAAHHRDRSGRPGHRLVDDRHARYSCPFQLHGVAQTPRATGASTAEPGDGDGRLRGEPDPVLGIGRDRHAALEHGHRAGECRRLASSSYSLARNASACTEPVGHQPDDAAVERCGRGRGGPGPPRAAAGARWWGRDR